MSKILLVEDDKYSAGGIIDLFTSEGYEVDHALNGKSAFELLKDNQYNLIITDIMMPELDGIKFLHRIRSIGIDTPVIVITAYDTTENIMAVYDLGAVEILGKPFDIDDFLKLVQDLLKGEWKE
ncbi:MULTISPECIES: response regulator transcription factor [Calditerrivibrio]|uniref:response regulator transcription factor n=1 Tax=Calditerrivibrio TaxID=545865 RepID=UPI003C753A7E